MNRCKYCDIDYQLTHQGDTIAGRDLFNKTINNSLFGEINATGNLYYTDGKVVLYVGLFTDKGDKETVMCKKPINYCPICGRKIPLEKIKEAAGVKNDRKQ